MPERATVDVLLPRWLADGLHAGKRGEVSNKGDRVSIRLHAAGRRSLGHVALPAMTEAPCELRVTLPDELGDQRYEFALRQLFDGLEVGRIDVVVHWHVREAEEGWAVGIDRLRRGRSSRSKSTPCRAEHRTTGHGGDTRGSSQPEREIPLFALAARAGLRICGLTHRPSGPSARRLVAPTSSSRGRWRSSTRSGWCPSRPPASHPVRSWPTSAVPTSRRGTCPPNFRG